MSLVWLKVDIVDAVGGESENDRQLGWHRCERNVREGEWTEKRHIKLTPEMKTDLLCPPPDRCLALGGIWDRVALAILDSLTDPYPRGAVNTT